MKAWIDELINEKTELQIAPLIDVVFLLLIFFMVTSSLKRAEADLNLSLPGVVAQSEQLEIPDEQIIEVKADGSVLLNQRKYVAGSVEDMKQLEHLLLRYRQASELSMTKAVITIAADDDSSHAQVVDVLNACAGAGIKNISFGNAP